MSSKDQSAPSPDVQPRRRMSREERYRQLLDVAWRLVREDGTEVLTLGRLAEQSGVTKPVVYDHFATRQGLLAALYREFAERQTELMDAALHAGRLTLSDCASVIASSYVDCGLRKGREISGVIAALEGSPELEKIKREYEAAFNEKLRGVLTPFAGGGSISTAGLRAMMGAAEALSCAAIAGDITVEQARDELFDVIISMVRRSEPVGSNDDVGR